MHRILRRFLPVVLAMSLLCSNAPQARAEVHSTLRAFVITSTYGVIAGALTGLASLAFYSSPSDHTRNVAMGASLGLYTGLLLGAYIVYVPDAKPSTGAPPPEKKDSSDDPMHLGAANVETELQLAQLQPQPPTLQPTLSYMPQQGVQLGVLYRF